jgi:peptidoglycan hydrolase-like protein with peptidoglycan-binding domain
MKNFNELYRQVKLKEFLNSLNEEQTLSYLNSIDENLLNYILENNLLEATRKKVGLPADAAAKLKDAELKAATNAGVNDLKKQNNMSEPAADLDLNNPNSLRAQFARGPNPRADAEAGLQPPQKPTMDFKALEKLERDAAKIQAVTSRLETGNAQLKADIAKQNQFYDQFGKSRIEGEAGAKINQADADFKAASQKAGARRAKDLKADSMRAKYAQGPIKDPTDAGRISPERAAELKANASAGANKYAPGEGLGNIKAKAGAEANAKINQADADFKATSQGIGVRRARDERLKQIAKGTAAAAALGTTAALLSKSSNDKGAQANNPYPSRERSFADKTKDVEKEFFVPKPGTTKYNIRMGSKGEDVKRLQQAIGVKADGVMGKDTADALANFQKQHGLKVDRVGGDQTFGKIKQIEALKNLRDADPKGAQSFAQSQIDNPAKRIGAGSIQTQSPLGGKRIFPDSKKLNMGFEHTSPLIEAFKKLHSSNIPNLFEAAKKAKKDWDGDGEVESGTEEWKGSRDNAIKKAMRNEESEGKKDAEKNPMSHERDAGTLKKPLRQLTPDEMPVSKVERTGKQSSTAYKIKKEIEISEARESFTKGTRKIKTYSHGDYHAEVRHNPDWQEYQVHFYKNGKHMGEGPVSYHGEDKEDAHDSAKAGLEFLNKRNTMSESVSFSEAELAHIASILEGNPIAPVPDDYSGAAGGVSVRDLSDETVAEGIRGMKRKDSKFKDSPKRYSNEYAKGYREPGTKSKAEARDEMEKAVASYRARGGKIKKK